MELADNKPNAIAVLDQILTDTGEYLGSLIIEERIADLRAQYPLSLKLKAQTEAVIRVKEIINKAMKEAIN